MKHFFLYGMISLCCLVAVSCQKDKNSPEVIETYRLKAWYDTINNYRFEIIYAGENVAEVQFSVDNSVVTKYIWTYEGNTITIRTHFFIDSVWRQTDNYKRLTYNDNHKLIESYNNHEGDTPNSVYKYYWEGDRVVSQDLFIAGTKTTFSYSYENDLLTEVMYQQEGTDYWGKEMLRYKAGKISEMAYWKTDTITRINFFYDDDRLDRIEKRSPHSGSTTVLVEDYTFDSNHNLSQKVRYTEGPSPFLSPTFVEYESGKGNFDQYWLVRYGWLAVYLYPNMIPARDAHGFWSNYSTQGVLQY